MTRLDPRPTPGRDAAPPLPRIDPITALPIVVLYPHGRCNCRCRMCDIWRVTSREEITASHVAAWIPEWRRLGVRRVVLSGGEPLMHSHLWDLCALMQDAGMGITLLSTGILLARHAPAVVRYCDDVVVSLDGPPPIHDAIRNIPHAFDKLARGVDALRARDPNVRVSGRCTVQRANYHALRRTVAAAQQLGLDRISLLAADVSSEAFNRPGGWSAERVEAVALVPDDLPRLAAELTALELEYESEFERGYIAESPDKLRARLHQYFAAVCGEAEFAPVECNAPWVSSVIETNGDVRPCFFQPPLGNVHTAGGLDAVLNAPSAVRWRRGLDMRRNEVCRRCVCSLSLRPEAVGAGHA